MQHHFVLTKVFLFITFISTPALSHSQSVDNFNQVITKKTDWENEGLKSKVRSVCNKSYRLDEKSEEILVDTKTVSFNKDGNYILIVDNLEDKRIFPRNYADNKNDYDLKTTFSYESGSCLSKIAFEKKNNPNILERFFRCQDGKIFEQVNFHKITLSWEISKILFYYDFQGNLIKKESYNNFQNYRDRSLDKLYKYSTYSYNEKNQNIENNYYRSNTLQDKYSFQYDKKGNMVEQNYKRFYSVGNSLKIDYQHKYLNSFDDKNNLIKTTYSEISSNGDVLIGKSYDWYTYEYDKNNKIRNMKKYVHFYSPDKDELVESFEYKAYDTHGNWIEKVENYYGIECNSKNCYTRYVRTIDYNP
jgi:hypothetical protein